MSDKKTILLVEDEPEFRAGIRMRLEANGYEVLEAKDGSEGLEMARQKKPDLMVLDLMLPKMGGYQVARLLKFDDKHKDIPVIILTARSQQADRETGAQVGADAYLTKPVKAEELLAKIAELLNSDA